MPSRERRLKAQRFAATHHPAADLQRHRHARDLAHLAGLVADVHGCPVQGQGLIVSRLGGAAGVIVWLAQAGRPLLHVLQSGQVMYFESGEWEQRLVALAKEVTVCG